MTALPYSEFSLYEPPYRRWGYEARPLPPNARFVPFYEPGKYDLAILHVDGECADPQGHKGDIYKKLDALITDIPKIVINHGTPWIPEKFMRYVKRIEDPRKQIEMAAEICRSEMRKLIGDNTMVVNSAQAARDWGWGNPIIHGMAGNPQEQYFDLPKEMQVTFNISPAGWGYYYNREVMNDIITNLNDQGIPADHLRVDVKPRNFDEYRDYIGKILIAVFPTRESPMPRARTEHMLSGSCIVSTKNHDIGDYFQGLEFRKTENGDFIRDEQGEIIPETDPLEAQIVWCDVDRSKDATEKIIWLFNHPDIAKKIGQNGKARAQIVFDWKRYRHDWYELLKSINVL